MIDLFHMYCCKAPLDEIAAKAPSAKRKINISRYPFSGEQEQLVGMRKLK
jgi:hypothetical protein